MTEDAHLTGKILALPAKPLALAKHMDGGRLGAKTPAPTVEDSIHHKAIPKMTLQDLINPHEGVTIFESVEDAEGANPELSQSLAF